MKCSCCDKLLTDQEATAKFKESGAFAEMCTECQGFLPRSLTIVNRVDLDNKLPEENPETNLWLKNHGFNEDTDYGYEN